jgi:alkaline phosphatase
MRLFPVSTFLTSVLLWSSSALAASDLHAVIRLPERMRLLSGQLFDVRVEATGLDAAQARIELQLDGQPWARKSQAETSTDNDEDASDHDQQWTYRALQLESGAHVLTATVRDGKRSAAATAQIGVQDFSPVGGKSLILFIGDGMGTAYRDAGRIVGASANGGLREGRYDHMQQMDQLPVSGMVLTHALDSLVPDSACTASAWSMGNKAAVGALSVFPDNDDFKIDGSEATQAFALNNPRVETLWEYLKRRFDYRTGVVSTAAVTDATPAAEGSHVAYRGLQLDVSRQFVDGAFTSGPVYDVILGGGRSLFDARAPERGGDGRDLTAELAAKGFRYARTRTELLATPAGGDTKLLGLFHSGNMTVAYDKLGLQRPDDEAPTGPGAFPDQPFLDEMVTAAVKTLGRDDHPFILMVEGAQIDKQSHINHANGVFWEVVEFDRAVGVGRTFAAQRPGKVLTLVTADHDQTMTLLGVADTDIPGAIQNLSAGMALETGGRPVDQVEVPGAFYGFPDYVDADGDGYPENSNRLKLAVGFRTGDHQATSVPITAEGPGALLFTGYFDQTDLFYKMARALGSDTRPLDAALSARDRYDIIEAAPAPRH